MCSRLDRGTLCLTAWVPSISQIYRDNDSTHKMVWRLRALVPSLRVCRISACRSPSPSNRRRKYRHPAARFSEPSLCVFVTHPFTALRRNPELTSVAYLRFYERKKRDKAYSVWTAAFRGRMYAYTHHDKWPIHCVPRRAIRISNVSRYVRSAVTKVAGCGAEAVVLKIMGFLHTSHAHARVIQSLNYLLTRARPNPEPRKI